MQHHEIREAVRLLIDRAIDAGVFPAAVVEIGSSAEALWREPFGTLTFDSSSPSTRDHTLFDLASLTKPLATTSVILDLIEAQRLTLDEKVSCTIAEWTGEDRHETTVRDLLEHTSGLLPRLIDPPPASRREFEHDICALPLEYPRRTRALYSDLDFLLLGFIAADRGAAKLDAQFDRLQSRLVERSSDDRDDRSLLQFAPIGTDQNEVAPTVPLPEDPRRGRRLTGDVHDHYAAALGGVAGHAGLFGDVAAVGRIARALLRGAAGDPQVPPPFSPALTRLATRRSDVPRSSRALGWDTMLPTSSCGTTLTPRAFGHVGFTGTSLWVDPGLDRYFVLLTNRVCGGGTSDDMQQVRRAFHDAASGL